MLHVKDRATEERAATREASFKRHKVLNTSALLSLIAQLCSEPLLLQHGARGALVSSHTDQTNPSRGPEPRIAHSNLAPHSPAREPRLEAFSQQQHPQGAATCAELAGQG